MKKTYALINFIIVVLLIFWNYWVNSGAFNGMTVGEVSNKYANLFTPASYAFAIWGVIYIALLLLTISQLVFAYSDSEISTTILQVGPWLSIANVGNAVWLWFWMNEYIGLSVIIMLLILFSLIQIILRTNMERWDAPLKIIASLWWPICLYSGWIAVATIANISAWLTKINWSALFTEVDWTILMISIAGILNLLMIYFRNMREFAAVGLWALIAIAIRHWDVYPSIQWTAVLWVVILFIAINIHAYKNRSTNPLKKLLDA